MGSSPAIAPPEVQLTPALFQHQPVARFELLWNRLLAIFLRIFSNADRQHPHPLFLLLLPSNLITCFCDVFKMLKFKWPPNCNCFFDIFRFKAHSSAHCAASYVRAGLLAPFPPILSRSSRATGVSTFGSSVVEIAKRRLRSQGCS
jgi:hypothetical protein